MTRKLSRDPEHISLLHVFIVGVVVGFLALSNIILPNRGIFVTRGDFIEQQLPFIV